MAGHSDTHCLLNHPETQGIADVLLLNDRQSVFDVINHYLAAGHKKSVIFPLHSRITLRENDCLVRKLLWQTMKQK